jgi:hypothetical protein
MLSNLDDSDSEADNGDSESDEKEVVATEAVVTEAAVDPGEDAASEVKSVGESEAVTSLEEGRPQSCQRPRRASLATSRPNDGKIFFFVDVSMYDQLNFQLIFILQKILNRVLTFAHLVLISRFRLVYNPKKPSL